MSERSRRLRAEAEQRRRLEALQAAAPRAPRSSSRRTPPAPSQSKRRATESPPPPSESERLRQERGSTVPYTRMRREEIPEFKRLPPRPGVNHKRLWRSLVVAGAITFLGVYLAPHDHHGDGQSNLAPVDQGPPAAMTSACGTHGQPIGSSIVSQVAGTVGTTVYQVTCGDGTTTLYASPSDSNYYP